MALASAQLRERTAAITIRRADEDLAISGKVTFVSPEANPVNGQVRVHILVDNSRGQLINSIEIGKLDELAANQKQTLPKLSTSTTQELGDLVVQALVHEGLYEKEAKAMVETWQKSWFTESGTRVLYMVPTPITEELLPLHVSPKPHESVRVLVGRLEIMSPETEKAVMQSVALSSQQRAAYYAKANPKVRVEPFPIPKSMLDFGRMAEPALIRIDRQRDGGWSAGHHDYRMGRPARRRCHARRPRAAPGCSQERRTRSRSAWLFGHG